MSDVNRGYGAARPRPVAAPKPPYCISPQLAPPVLSPASKKMFAGTEDYHKKSK